MSEEVRPGATGVRVEDHGAVRVVTITRPAVRNALDLPSAVALSEAFEELDADPALRVGVLAGEGGHFCAGMDLAAFAATGQRPEVPGRGFGFTRRPPLSPVVAAVEGNALAGGCELVLACDLVVAAEDARLGLPEVTLGLVAGSGGLLRLASQVPPAVASWHGLTGRPMAAAQALRWGLVNELTAPGAALERAVALAAEVARYPAPALRATKELLARGTALSVADLARQDALLEAVVDSAEAREGVAAFTQRRPPSWRGGGTEA